MKVFVYIEKKRMEEVGQLLKAVKCNYCVLPDWELRNVPEGCVAVKITTRSAAAMFNVGGILNEYLKKE